MSQGVNLIITCDNKKCQYNYEGECGKDVLSIDDSDCLEQNKGETDERNKR